MKRSLLNLLAVGTILVGGWTLVSPAPALATSRAACCADCCGLVCWKNTDGSCGACDYVGCDDEEAN